MFEQLVALKALGDDTFEAPPAPDKGERTYGGQFLAQSIAAAFDTIGDDWLINSLHAYFLRPGDVNAPATLAVERVRDGRTFATRQMTISQHGKELFRMLASMQKPAESPVYAKAKAPGVPRPEAVTCTYDEFTLSAANAEEWHGSDRPMEILYINPPNAPRGVPVTEDQYTWTRVRGTLRDNPGVHQAGIAYLSDSSLVDHILLPHGLRWQDEGFIGASLDHSMWFHRPARADEWLLFTQSVEATGSGRGLASGRFYDLDGNLVVTCTQEGLMRWKDGPPT
jgi:acyl-CoA thioesterase II